MLYLSPDFGIVDVLPSPHHFCVQLVMLTCGCVGVWSPPTDALKATLDVCPPAVAEPALRSVAELVGYSVMCYHHECFKLLARVQLSAN